MKYILHVVGLPHTQTTDAYNCCAYTGKVIRFCKMMMDLGHTVHLYGAGENQAPCSSFSSCYPARWTPENYLDVPFDADADHWQTMNRNVIKAIGLTKSPRDFLCLIAGRCQQQIAQAFPEMIAVEFGVGYSGIFAKYRVFESCAWQHMIYGAASMGHPTIMDGSFYDTVIPNYYDHNEFPLVKKKDNYFLYMGRLTDRKGWRIAQEVCATMGLRFVVAGPGKFDGYGDYVGVLDNKAKAKMLGEARAVFCPSLYIEPFCGVMAEAMLCGTPVISTPWGTFSENIVQGETGFRCKSFKEFCTATEYVRELIPFKIMSYAFSKFSMFHVRRQYQEYFDHLYTLWEKGWYQV